METWNCTNWNQLAERSNIFIINSYRSAEWTSRGSKTRTVRDTSGGTPLRATLRRPSEFSIYPRTTMAGGKGDMAGRLHNPLPLCEKLTVGKKFIIFSFFVSVVDFLIVGEF